MSNAAVLITRPQMQAQKTAQQVKEMGFEPVLCPLLEIETVEHDLPDTSYDALILTSANAAQCCDLNAFSKDIEIFTVGEQLSALLSDRGFKYIISAPTALDLADQILKSPAAKILYLRGEDIRCDLAALLPQKTIDERVVYKALQKTDLPADILQKLENGEIQYALFYSVRTAQTFVQAMQKAGAMSCVQGTKALCLSPSVLESVSVLPWKESCSAPRPTGRALLEELIRAKQG